MKVKYVGPAKDYSGYGEANRHDIAALLEARVAVTSKIPKYTLEIADFGQLGERIYETEGKDIAYDKIILHTTPNVYRQYMEPNKYHIARVIWETTKLPPDFALNIQACDEIWTASEACKNALIASGITKPIFVIPEAIDDKFDIDEVKPYTTDLGDSYKFYSIFEWTERKNPGALLEAYFKEFQNGENVSLTIKTYVDNFNRDKKEEIDSGIRLVKKRLNLPKYPKVTLLRKLMDRNQMYRFHKTFDCFVSASRGEGWGIPQMEALFMNKPVISTAYNGIHEYLKQGEHALLVPYKMIPLTANSRNQQWYTPDQEWADIDIEELRKYMRLAFENQDRGIQMGVAGGKFVREKFGLSVVGDLMRKRLQAIDDTILYPIDRTGLSTETQ